MEEIKVIGCKAKGEGEDEEVVYFIKTDSYTNGVVELAPYVVEVLERNYRSDVEEMKFFEVEGSDLMDCNIEYIYEGADIFTINEEEKEV